MAKGGGALGFLVLQFWLFFRFFGFGVHCSLRIYWFLVFMKNTNGFLVLISDMIFGFFLFDLFYLGFGFSSI